MRGLKEAAAATKELSDEKIQELETNLSISRFGLERFSKDNALVRFYTGFPTYDHLKLFLNLLNHQQKQWFMCIALCKRTIHVYYTSSNFV